MTATRPCVRRPIPSVTGATPIFDRIPEAGDRERWEALFVDAFPASITAHLRGMLLMDLWARRLRSSPAMRPRLSSDSSPGAVDSFVIAAEPDDHALGIYEGLGCVRAEAVSGVCRWATRSS